MKKIYSVEVKDRGKWREIERHKCNRQELEELKKSMAHRISSDTSPINQFRIKECVLRGYHENE